MLRVGDRIRVFEIKSVSIYDAEDLIGKQRAEDVNSDKYGNNFGTDIISNDIWYHDGHIHLGIDESRGHIKHVATMVITKLK